MLAHQRETPQTAVAPRRERLVVVQLLLVDVVRPGPVALWSVACLGATEAAGSSRRELAVSVREWAQVVWMVPVAGILSR